MNTSPHFRYYVALALLTMLGLLVRVQNAAGPEGAAATRAVAATPPTASYAAQ